MSVRRSRSTNDLLPEPAVAVARAALEESRVRGLPAAEEYRVIADRLSHAGFRDLPSGSLIDWIETTVAGEYERFLMLRSLGDRINRRIAAGDLAGAGWEIACELSPDARRRLISGIMRLNDIDEADETTVSKGLWRGNDSRS